MAMNIVQGKGGKVTVNTPEGPKEFPNALEALAFVSAENERLAAAAASNGKRERKPIEGAEITIEGSKMTIVLDLNANLGNSASGKSVIVATTRGNAPIEFRRQDGKRVLLGLNAYAK